MFREPSNNRGDWDRRVHQLCKIIKKHSGDVTWWQMQVHKSKNGERAAETGIGAVPQPPPPKFGDEWQNPSEFARDQRKKAEASLDKAKRHANETLEEAEEAVRCLEELRTASRIGPGTPLKTEEYYGDILCQAESVTDDEQRFLAGLREMLKEAISSGSAEISAADQRGSGSW